MSLLIPQDEPEGTANKIKEGKTFKTNFSLTIGSFTETHAGFLLTYQREQAGKLTLLQ